jgi:Na+/proline symporter
VGVVTGLAVLDWVVLVGTIAAIVSYGAWHSRNIRDATSFARGDGTLRWPTIGLSIMATQASAITFISTPGQGYESGMGCSCSGAASPPASRSTRRRSSCRRSSAGRCSR